MTRLSEPPLPEPPERYHIFLDSRPEWVCLSATDTDKHCEKFPDIGSLAAWPSYGAVSAAKSALESHVRQLAVELAPMGVTANAIMAGVTQTPALAKIPGADTIAEVAQSRNPHGRLTTPEDIAQCLLALARPETAWMTGNVLRVDGGETISA